MEYSVGQFAGTTDSLSPLSRILKLGQNEAAHLFSPFIATHCVNVARWHDRYKSIIDNNEVLYATLLPYPKLKDGELCFIEATAPRCRWVPLSHYPLKKSLRKHIVYVGQQRNLIDEEATNQLLWSYIGKPYQYSIFLSLLGIFSHDPKREYCSEITAAMLAAQRADPPLPAEWFKTGVSPLQVQVHAEANGWVLWRCGYDPEKLF